MTSSGLTEVQLALGLIFLISAGAKLRNTAAFVRGLADYDVKLFSMMAT